MERDEEESLFTCADCGAAIWTDIDRYFPISDETYLCWTCAIRRGGSYDADEDRWTTAPGLEGIADERRPHA